MEDTEATTRQRTAGRNGSQGTDNTLMSGKPLHRFLRKDPRCVGIVLLMFGFAELLMGFVMADGKIYSSSLNYVPFWQGTLFLVSGILSIYTELHPSKKLVTVCVSMYGVSLVGILVSIVFRIHFLLVFQVMSHFGHYRYKLMFQVFYLEIILLTSSVCVFGLLIFLIVSARFALKSTHTQVIVQYIPAAATE